MTGCRSKEQTGGLKVYSLSSSLGTALYETRYSFNISITNENPYSIYIKSVKPIINEKIKDRIITKETTINVNKSLNSGETTEIKGELMFNIKGLNKTDILELGPFITDIKVLSEEIINLELKYRK